MHQLEYAGPGIAKHVDRLAADRQVDVHIRVARGLPGTDPPDVRGQVETPGRDVHRNLHGLPGQEDQGVPAEDRQDRLADLQPHLRDDQAQRAKRDCRGQDRQRAPGVRGLLPVVRRLGHDQPGLAVVPPARRDRPGCHRATTPPRAAAWPPGPDAAVNGRASTAAGAPPAASGRPAIAGTGTGTAARPGRWTAGAARASSGWPIDSSRASAWRSLRYARRAPERSPGADGPASAPPSRAVIWWPSLASSPELASACDRRRTAADPAAVHSRLMSVFIGDAVPPHTLG